MSTRETMQMALDALSGMEQNYGNLWQVAQTPEELDGICNALRAELAKPEPEPVGYFAVGGTGGSVKTRFVQFSDSCAGNPGVIPLYRKDEM